MGRIVIAALVRAGPPLASLVVILSACGDAPGEGNEVGAATDSSSSEVIDWERRASSLELPGWSIEFCEGEGPFLCVARDGRQIGSVELLRTAVANHAVISEALGRGGSELEALDAAVSEFVAALSADRRIGFGEDYELQAEPTTPATVLGKPGLRSVVVGRLGDRVMERIVHYHAIQGDTAYLLAATGTEGGGPLGEFTIDDLKAFEPFFGEVAAASRVRTDGP